MMKKSTLIVWSLLLVSLFSAKNAGAQTHRSVVKFSRKAFIPSLKAGVFSIKNIECPIVNPNGPFLAVSVVWYVEDEAVGDDHLSLFFTKKNEERWGGNLFQVHPDGHAESKNGRFISELFFLENEADIFSINAVEKKLPDSLEIHFFDPGPSLQTAVGPKGRVDSWQSPPHHPSSLNPHPAEKMACTCPQPAFQGRLDWCPDGSCPTDPTPEYVPDPTHVIVHHTAGTNVASDWAAVVRSIWDFHVNTNGWDDIGYNWLVDPNGVLYEGRGDGRLGAHFCAQNGKTTGICVMGDFTNIEPTSAAVGMLSQFLAWETCDENIDPLGTSFHSGSGLTLMNISGHRDGCQTSCPGDMFYPMLPLVRQNTADIIATGCDSNAPAAPTILAVTFVGQGIVGLSWQDNAVGETGYILERSIHTNTDFQLLAQLPANSTNHWDDTVQDGNTYYYRVKAEANGVSSSYSNETIVQTGIADANDRLLSDQTVRFFPNPTSGELNISIDNPWFGKTAVAMFDALGRNVVPNFYLEKNDAHQTMQLDLGNLPSGLYSIKLMQGEVTGVFKLVKI